MTQADALNILKLGKNVYITGAAGSGKTYLLNQYIEYLKQNRVDVGITASTGIAATHMGGVTIHSWTGMGIKDKLTAHDMDALEEKQYLWKRFEKVKVLIIDEVSMLHHFRLDLVEKICRTFKRNEKPFGGIQVVLCGDFFQLPPVARMGEPEAHFVYKSEAWKRANFTVCYLEEQFRQSDDEALRVLNAIRDNEIDEVVIETLKKRCAPGVLLNQTDQSDGIEIGSEWEEVLVEYEDEIVDDNSVKEAQKKKTEAGAKEPTRLYTHNADVDTVNAKALAELEGEHKTYRMNARGGDGLVMTLKKSCLAPEALHLKVGARVMFVKNNFDKGYVNGTLGVVVSLNGEGGATGPVVETFSGKKIEVEPASWAIEENGVKKAELNQYPLRLAWAITVHKSQGMSLDAVEVDLSKTFERGMGYVALSRVRSFAGLRLLGFNPMALQVSEEVLEMDRELREASAEENLRLKKLSVEEREKKQKAFLETIAFSAGKPGSGGGKSGTAKTTYEETKELLLKKVSLADIAKQRHLTKETVISHIEKLLGKEALMEGDLIDEADPDLDVSYLKYEIPPKKLKKILAAFEECYETSGDYRLSPVKNKLGASVSYGDIRLARLFLK